MNVIAARNEDLDALEALYAAARQRMVEGGNPTQWAGGYPDRGLLQWDIRCKRLYVGTENGVPVAAFCLQEEPEKTYEHIDGAWLNDAPYATVHRIATTGERKGVGEACFHWCLKRFENLRADTHRDNLPMQGLLKKLGFAYCGVIRVEDGSERLAYQHAKA